MKEYKPIPNYEGLYSISPEGDIKSHPKSVRYSRWGNDSVKNLSEKIMKPRIGVDGYLFVNLRKDGIPKAHRIHRVVAQVYIPNNDSCIYIDHIDMNKTNNTVGNLRWCTGTQNSANCKKKSNGKTSKYKGVCWSKRYKKYVASITIKRKHIHIAYSLNEKKAAQLYDKAAIELFGDFAKTNKMLGLLEES